MKRRYLYALLFGVPGLFLTILLSLQVLFAVVDIAPLLGYELSEMQMLGTTGVILLIFWIALIAIGYSIGTWFENGSRLNRKHALISLGLSLLMFGYIVFWSMRETRYEADSELCNNYCFSNGYSASVMPPVDDPERACYCSNYSSGESVTIPIEDIDPETLK